MLQRVVSAPDAPPVLSDS